MNIGNLIKWDATERYGIVIDVDDKVVTIAWIGYFDLLPSDYYLLGSLKNTFRVIG